MTAPATTTPRRPYPGLRAFDRDEAELFFGRDEQVDQLLDKLAGGRFLAVLGTSGAGKSSLVRAGLLPALASGVLLRERTGAGPWPGTRWSIAELRPGERPFRRLAQALLADTGWGPVLAARQPDEADPAAALEADLRRGDQALAWLLGIAPLPPGERLLILIDQFEELFRFHRADGADAAAFVALLLGGVSHPDCHVVITLRSEFLGECARFPDLPEAINAGLFLTPRLRPTELADAIALPPRLPGFDGEVAPDLVRALLAETGAGQDRLPLLQHLLMRLWDQTPRGPDGRRRLDLPGLAAIGGLADALHRDAEEAYDALGAPAPGARASGPPPTPTDAEPPPSPGQQVAEVLFRALTEPGAGGEAVRRPVSIAEVAAVAGVDPPAVLAAAAPFLAPGRNFLVCSGPPGDPDSRLDITHEALIRQWRRLAAWTAAEAADAALYRRLADAARRWPAAQSLWRDPELAAALAWREARAPTPAWARRYRGPGVSDDREFERAMDFLNASRAGRAEEQAEQERRARVEVEHAEAIARLAREAEDTRTRQLFEANLTHAALLARVEDYVRAWQVLGQTVPLDGRIAPGRRHARNLLAGLVDLHRGVADRVYRGADAALYKLDLSPDGRWLVAGGERGTLVVFDAASGELVRRLAGHDPAAGTVGAVTAVRFTGDGGALYSAGDDGRILRWALPDWRIEATWQAPAAVWALALSPDGKRLASGNRDKGITIWDTGSGEVLRTLTGESSNIADGNALAFLPDGRLVAGGYRGQVGIWDPHSGNEQVLAGLHTDQVNSVAVSPDGRSIASGSSDNSIVVWDLAGGTGRRLRGHENKVMGLAFDPTGRQLLSASYDNTLRLWDLATGTPLRVFQGHSAGLWSVLVRDLDGAPRAFTAANDGTLRRWPLAQAGQWVWDLQRDGRPQTPTSTLVLPDAGLVLIGYEDGAIELRPLPTDSIDPAAAQVHKPDPTSPTPSVVGAAWSRDPDPNAPTASGPCQDGAPTARDASNPGPDPAPAPLLRIADAHRADVNRLAVSPDGETIASAGHEGTARLWRLSWGPDGPTLTPLHRLTLHQGSVHGLAFSPDGALLATAGYDGRVGLFDVATGEGKLTRCDEIDSVVAVSFTPDGRHVLTAQDGERRLVRWHRTALGLTDPATIARLADLPLWATLDPAGRQVAVTGRGSMVTILGLPPADGAAPPAPRRLVGHESTVYRAAYLPDGAQLATVSADMTLRLWDPGAADGAPAPADGDEAPAGAPLFTLRLPALKIPGQQSPLWDFDLRCTADGAGCWLAVPLTMGRLALYRLPWASPPPTLAAPPAPVR